MSESCGSNAEGEVCTRKRAHKELSDSAESSEKPMASTPEQPRPSKVINKFGDILVPFITYKIYNNSYPI